MQDPKVHQAHVDRHSSLGPHASHLKSRPLQRSTHSPRVEHLWGGPTLPGCECPPPEPRLRTAQAHLTSIHLTLWVEARTLILCCSLHLFNRCIVPCAYLTGLGHLLVLPYLGFRIFLGNLYGPPPCLSRHSSYTSAASSEATPHLSSHTLLSCFPLVLIWGPGGGYHLVGTNGWRPTSIGTARMPLRHDGQVTGWALLRRVQALGWQS